MEKLRSLIDTTIPSSYYTSIKKTITNSIDHFNNQDAYYLNDDIRMEVDIKELIKSKYNEEVVESLKFLLGVKMRIIE